MIKDLLLIIVGSALVNNVVLSQFLGLCPFLGVSKKTETSAGMGAAVIFVITLACIATSLIYNYIMLPLDISYLQTIVFILVIAALVQFVEMFLKKNMVSLYESLGVYLPLITTNCAVLGVTELVIGDMSAIIGEGVAMNIGWAALYALFAGLGFTLVMIIMSGMREKLNCYKTPKAISGFPIAMVTACFICMAFTVFSYISI